MFFEATLIIATFGAVLSSPTVVFRNTNIFSFEDDMNKTLECVKEIMKTGDENIPLPTFQPLVIDEISVKLQDLGIQNGSGGYTLKKLTIGGIPNWETTKLEMVITVFPLGTKVDLTMRWSAFDFQTEYISNSTVLGHTVTGSGIAKGSVIAFGIDVYFYAILNADGTISLDSFSVRPYVRDIELHIDGMYIDGVESSRIVEEGISHVPQLIEDNIDEIDEWISAVVMDSMTNPNSEIETKEIIEKLILMCQP